MSWARVEQAVMFPLPPRMPTFRRISCACGCGRWWYWQRAFHRPPAYATPECALKARRLRRRASGSSGEGAG